MKNKYKVVVTIPLKEKLIRIKFTQWDRLEKLKRKLEINPFAGKRLGYNLFEKKWGAFRIYYIIFEKVLTVFVIDYSHKKLQKSTIDYLLSRWNELTMDLKEYYI